MRCRCSHVTIHIHGTFITEHIASQNMFYCEFYCHEIYVVAVHHKIRLGHRGPKKLASTGALSVLDTLQHTATHCNTMYNTATHCSALQLAATHCNTLQHTAAHCNTLSHTATHCNTLQHTATHCNTLQHTATHCNRTRALPRINKEARSILYTLNRLFFLKCSTCRSIRRLLHSATHCYTLPNTAKHRNTLQHTATHCNCNSTCRSIRRA